MTLKTKNKSSNAKNKSSNAKNKSSNASICKVYKSCAHVPCGATMNKCTPSYCYPNSSKNWNYCNMSNWKSRRYKKYKSSCSDESKCVLVKTKKNNNSVDVLTLHNKMPYIWRFLKPETRKHMVLLAKKPIKHINIPFSVFSHTKPNSRFINNMTKKNRNRLYKLRKKYRSI